VKKTSEELKAEAKEKLKNWKGGKRNGSNT
jgi:hypothetical protein